MLYPTNMINVYTCGWWVHTKALPPASLEHLVGDPQLLQLNMLTQVAQVIHIEDLLPKLEAADKRKDTDGSEWAHFSRPPGFPQQPTQIRQRPSPKLVCPQGAGLLRHLL